MVEVFPYDPHLWKARAAIRQQVVEKLAQQYVNPGGSK
jgi:hypothetical protein